MWDKVALQTNWKIQTCIMPQTSSHPSTASEEIQNVSANTSEESQNMSGNDNTQPVENSIISEESLRTTSNAPGVSDEHVLVEDPSPQTESQ